MPDIIGIEPMHYERYFLRRTNGEEERIQKKGDKFEYEYKREVSEMKNEKRKKKSLRKNLCD